MSADPFSNLIKATRLYFPQGHPMRRVVDVVSKMDFMGKYQNLQQTLAQLLYQLEEIAYWKRTYPNINYLKCQEKIEGQLAECDKQ